MARRRIPKTMNQNKGRADTCNSASAQGSCARSDSSSSTADTDKPNRQGRSTSWIWTGAKFVLLIAAAATAYIARDSQHVLGFSSSGQNQVQKAPSKNVGFMAHVLQKSKGQNICKPEGFIMDTYSDFDTIESLNHRVTKSLRSLMETKFFRTLKVDLYKPCDFWTTEGSCFQRDCIAVPLEDSDIPEMWRTKKIDQTNLGPFMGAFPRKRQEFSAKDFSIVNDETYGDGVWIDLITNPERFTGYAGAGANAIWMSIYEHNCFGVPPYVQDTAGGWGSQLVNVDGKSNPFVQPPRKRGSLVPFLENLAEEERGITLPKYVPREYRMFYRAVSGLHASTSTHICSDYFNSTSGKWEANLDCFIARIGAYPDRLQNIYFNFVLLTRAVQKMAPYITSYNYAIGDAKEDAQVRKLIPRVLKEVEHAGMVFDDEELFLGRCGSELKTEFKTNFRNISRIMDCTGCEKCRLWGKTQTLGIGTALKALFSYSTRAFRGSGTAVDFKRNEIVSLLNTYYQFSRSINAIEQFRSMYQDLVTDWRAANHDEL